MAETLIIPQNATREEIYTSLMPQLNALVMGETDLIANASNIAAALKEAFGFFWVGFYFVKNDELVLGPFQGPIACTRIKKGRGVCGKSWEKAEIIVVPDVDQFPGHIACSSLSRSEIVIPFFNSKNEVAGVIDIDSELLNDFSEIDARFGEKIGELVSSILSSNEN
jgi:L-methionine (R)-S-oxide reductase